MDFALPEAALEPLHEFMQFSGKEVELLVNALVKAKPSLSINDLGSEVEKTAQLENRDIKELVGVLAGMHMGRTSANVALPEFIEDVCRALTKKGPHESLPKNWGEFKKNLSLVLSAGESLGVTAKAIDVMTEHEHVFSHARIITDLRPIFADDSAQQPPAAVIIHVLSIYYRGCDGERMQKCFALDSGDLKSLAKTIERAQEKQETLKKMLSGISTIYLESK